MEMTLRHEIAQSIFTGRITDGGQPFHAVKKYITRIASKINIMKHFLGDSSTGIPSIRGCTGFRRPIYKRGKKFFIISDLQELELRCLEYLIDQLKINVTKLPLREDKLRQAVGEWPHALKFLESQNALLSHMSFLEHYDEILVNYVLPALENNTGDSIREGAQGKVVKVKIESRSINEPPVAGGTEFAMKIIREEHIAKREQEFLVALCEGNVYHSHITRSFTAFHYKTNYYIISEWGTEDLSEYMKNSRPDHELGYRTWFKGQMIGLVGALEAIHNIQSGSKTCGYHHDIKPNNVLIFGEERTFKFTDWGCANATGKTPSNDSHASIAIGFPTYMPPECNNTTGPSSRPHDIWSLGCMSLEMLVWIVGDGPGECDDFEKARCNEGPHASFHINNNVKRSVTDKLSSLHDSHEGIWNTMLSQIERMLQGDPNARPRAEDIVSALR